MHLVIDLQGAQSSGSRHRGIGRYSLWLAQAIARNRGDHRVTIALNGLFADTVDELRREFSTLLPPDAIRIWESPGPVADLDPANDGRRKVAELVRESFLASLKPDFVLVSSLFEGLSDNAVTSIGTLHRAVPTATILYDLIPLIHRNPYLANPVVAKWYESKIDHLRRADLALAISDSSREEGLKYLGMSADECVAISTATDPRFRPIEIDPQRRAKVLCAFGIDKPFVMYTGGIDHRKNIEGLIRAFARLHVTLRRTHQLAIVCSIQPADRARLGTLARDSGLTESEVVFTGFVSEDDLLALYNLCTLFVFPSWHEGFGLPALEAMACGRAVIGADTSSVPEVIGRRDALFDPQDESAIADAIERVLSDPALRADLEQHGLQQSKKFSWDIIARRALEAIERTHGTRATRVPTGGFVRRPRMAFLSPLPPERSGISDYSAQLLPELARHYDIDVVIAQQEVTNEWVVRNCAIRSVEWFTTHASSYDRVLYQIGNSSYHQHMFDLLDRFPGVVMLHDFFLSGIVAHLDLSGVESGGWARRLYESHGYSALQARYAESDVGKTIFRYPANLHVLQRARAVLVHAETSRRMAREWYGPEAASDWTVVPLLRQPAHRSDRRAARERLGIEDDVFLACSFGMIAPTKQSARLVEAWAASVLARRHNCVLVFVGDNDPGDYGARLAERIADAQLGGRIRITGWADVALYDDYLAAADLGVQLRTLSRGETSAAVLDCMNHGMATIVNANGSMADLVDGTVLKIPDQFDQQDLVEAIETLCADTKLRQAIGSRAREAIHTEHNPRRCATKYRDAIEAAYAESETGSAALLRALGRLPRSGSGIDWSATAQAVVRLRPPSPRRAQFLVDVTGAVAESANPVLRKSVTAIVRRWLAEPPAGFRVEPVYACSGVSGYRYARAFTLAALGSPAVDLVDEPIDFWPGDRFLGLDSSMAAGRIDRRAIEALRSAGVTVSFVVADLSPVTLPEFFEHTAAADFKTWMETAALSDEVLSPSMAAADELADWLDVHGPKRTRALQIKVVDHVALFDGQTGEAVPVPRVAESLEAISRRPTFLSTGRIGARRGHDQLLAAFEALWSEGYDVGLVMVGEVESADRSVADALRQHPELNRRMFWFDEADDSLFGALCRVSVGLIAPSHGEGTAYQVERVARNGMAVIARDLPVYRNALGRAAHYFSGRSPMALAAAVKDWLLSADRRPPYRVALGTEPISAEICANAIWAAIESGPVYREWMPDGVHRFAADDRRLQTRVGQREGTRIVSNQQAGHLMFGPYLALPAGRYIAKLYGSVVGGNGGHATLDIAVERGRVLTAFELAPDESSSGLLAAMPFQLAVPCNDLEVRVVVNEHLQMTLSRLEVAAIADLPDDHEADEPKRLSGRRTGSTLPTVAASQHLSGSGKPVKAKASQERSDATTLAGSASVARLAVRP